MIQTALTQLLLKGLWEERAGSRGESEWERDEVDGGKSKLGNSSVNVFRLRMVE